MTRQRNAQYGWVIAVAVALTLILVLAEPRRECEARKKDEAVSIHVSNIASFEVIGAIAQRTGESQSTLLPLAARALAAQPDTTWPAPPRGTYQYADSSGLWRVVGGKSLEKDIRNYEETSAATNQWWPGYEVMVREPGDWYVFQIGLREGSRVILSSASKVILLEKRGRAIEGQMRLLRSPDTTSRDVWDARRSPLVVRAGGFLSGSIGPSVAVRFPWGKVNWREIRAIKIDGVNMLKAQGR